MEFRDHAVIYIKAGRGGDGKASFRREKYVDKGGPDGGDGGHGASIHVVADSQEATLLTYLRNPHVRADDGEHGGGANRHGKRGQDIYLKVPVGTLVQDLHTGVLLRDLKEHGDSVRVARGGNGGHGNKHFATAINQAPRQCVPGLEGEKRDLRLELKLIADVGLVGLPNAGKSTLISAVSAAHPKVADYPFTTLQPHPGIVELPGHRRFVMVDIPGLIEGASRGQGLGHRFLRHVERTRVIVHLIELAPMDGSDPQANHGVIVGELERYSQALAAKPRLTVFSKSDLLLDADARAAEMAEALGIEAYAVSSASRHNLNRLLEDCWSQLHPQDD